MNYGIWCEVREGATECRYSWLKGEDGKALKYTDRQTAEAEASMLNDRMSHPRDKALFRCSVKIIQMNKIYQIVTKNNELWLEDHLDIIEQTGRTIIGSETRKGLRDELKDEPKFEGLCGPLFGGFSKLGYAIIRYEDFETFKSLSS